MRAVSSVVLSAMACRMCFVSDGELLWLPPWVMHVDADDSHV